MMYAWYFAASFDLGTLAATGLTAAVISAGRRGSATASARAGRSAAVSTARPERPRSTVRPRPPGFVRAGGGAGREARHHAGDRAGGGLRLERQVLVEPAAGQVVQDARSEPAPAAVGERARQRTVDVDGHAQPARRDGEGPRVGLDAQRTAA